uniref:Uncharacterized protein n=1 Tax=Globisporangium ultimum (strain ATCC 200006 / CBS 805.95 / DAOM BR144) TaxID=431595 RepID=K3W528_GLOUD
MVIGGGGSNILRGGTHTYDCKTLVGNFVEETYCPNAVTQNWDGGATYESNARHQMQSGAGQHMREFGGGLKKPDDPKYDYNQLVGADKTRGASTWLSLSQSVYCNSAKPTEFAAPREMKGRRMPDDELTKHRKRWTSECDELVKARYVTESSATQDAVVKEQFRKVLAHPTQVSFK